MQERVLIVEDEASIRQFIMINLKRNNFEVAEACSGEEALEKVRSFRPQAVVLDIMLPGIDGFTVCQRLREEWPGVAVIMLTARGEDMDKVMGLELGADDYLVKPFNPLELVARIRSILRRVQIGHPEKSEIIRSPFRLEMRSQRLFKNDQPIDLTPREFALLKMFLEKNNQALCRDDILNLVWGEDYVGDTKTVDVHIRRLREKIEDNPSEPYYLETVWGYGYRWREGE